MVFNVVGSDKLNSMVDRDISDKIFDFWGKAPSEYFTKSDVLFSNYADALDGGFIYVYDKIILNNSNMSVPYGYLEGKWVYKSFVKGKLLTPDPSLNRVSNSDMPYVAGEEYRVCSCDGNLTNKGGYAPILSTRDEREYVRQTLSRIESAPY
jgi:hypothetical protein